MDTVFFSCDCYITSQFYDVDVMQVVYHGNYTRYMEEARSLLMDSLGYGYFEMQADGLVWPVVKLEIKYIKPILLKQRIRIHTNLIEYENRLGISYLFYDEHDTVLCKAKTYQMAVSLKTKKSCFTSKTLIEKVEAVCKKNINA